MILDWDPDKNASTRAARGFEFATAVLIFVDRVVTWQGIRRDYGERRMIAIEQTGGRFSTVVYTDRGDVRWIITAWPANRKERARWHASRSTT